MSDLMYGRMRYGRDWCTMSKRAAYLGFKRFIYANPVCYEGKNHKLMGGIRKRLLGEPCGTNAALSLSDAKTEVYKQHQMWL